MSAEEVRAAENRVAIAEELRRAGVSEEAITGGAVDAVVGLMEAGSLTMLPTVVAVVSVLRQSAFRAECTCKFGHSELNPACTRNRQARR